MFSLNKKIDPRSLLYFAGIFFVFGTLISITGSQDLPTVSRQSAASVLAVSPNYPYPPGDALYFNPKQNSGWFYIAKTLPERNVTFWVAPFRSFSVLPSDNSTLLLYGVTDLSTGKYYSGAIPGVFTESKDSVNLSFSWKGVKILSFSEKTSSTTNHVYSFETTLPVLGKVKDEIFFPEPFFYESGDGVVPMDPANPSFTSLYTSITPARSNATTSLGYWIDFQKFNVGSLSPESDELRSIFAAKFGTSKPNHRWGSIILNRAAGKLPAGTAIGYWDIFDSAGKRVPGGYTNIDVKIPGKALRSRTPFVIQELEYWNGANGKKYLSKWRLVRKDLGVDLTVQTRMENQEVIISGTGFYEGSVVVKDSVTNQVVGTGMWEETHDEGQDEK